MRHDESVYIVAEISANHNGSIERAKQIIQAAANAGANAVKLQTYTADTLTIACKNEYFQIKSTLWEGRSLYELYQEASMPWEWTPELLRFAIELGLDCFSTPFDDTSVDFLEECGVSCYKIASFEIVDIALLKKIASTGKPILMSTGMASLAEIDEAVTTLRSNGATDIVLLKCTSSYPAPPEEANLHTIPHLAETFCCSAGLSDHTMGSAVAVAAVALGARVIEKHITLSRADGGPDANFSMEPDEFARMVQDIRIVEKALGHVSYARTAKEHASLAFRRSLFVVENIKSGEEFTTKNVRSIRPGNGLHTRYLPTILGKKAKQDIALGTPVSWDFL